MLFDDVVKHVFGYRIKICPAISNFINLLGMLNWLKANSAQVIADIIIHWPFKKLLAIEKTTMSVSDIMNDMANGIMIEIMVVEGSGQSSSHPASVDLD